MKKSSAVEGLFFIKSSNLLLTLKYFIWIYRLGVDFEEQFTISRIAEFVKWSKKARRSGKKDFYF